MAEANQHRYGLKQAVEALRAPHPEYKAEDGVAIPGEEANRESVTWMLGEAEAHLDEQEQRLETFRTRAGQIGGFGAVLLGLSGALVPHLSAVDGRTRTVALLTFSLALILIATSVFLALLGVARPTRLRRIASLTHVKQFLDSEDLFSAEPWQLQLSRLREFPRVLRWYSWANRRKAAALFLAYGALAASVLPLTICVGTLALDDGRSETSGRSASGGGHGPKDRLGGKGPEAGQQSRLSSRRGPPRSK